jgi:hypothetical protein
VDRRPAILLYVINALLTEQRKVKEQIESLAFFNVYGGLARFLIEN